MLHGHKIWLTTPRMDFLVLKLCTLLVKKRCGWCFSCPWNSTLPMDGRCVVPWAVYMKNFTMPVQQHTTLRMGGMLFHGRGLVCHIHHRWNNTPPLVWAVCCSSGKAQDRNNMCFYLGPCLWNNTPPILELVCCSTSGVYFFIYTACQTTHHL